eukprot:gnl/MRDRNA2_/MRDRNA2_112293_c0_seq1.p1 gnl/MRDRNA2_/MRDRNA2_112293_c0~~gnl/MRDRNA2_/MRDRNA2_112293_c0_seq1.p1  ORF type:complete len:384 (+),score=101.13 gnl/MRDRNA2_/MRDRNA2_112293_c0_seq1:124-1275(+)
MRRIICAASLLLCTGAVDALPPAYKACQGQVAGAQCKVPGALPAANRRGSCIELLPSERGCNSALSEVEENATLACISCEVGSAAFGRMDQWAVFACGAVVGSLFTTALCTVVLKWRKTLEGAREMRRSNRDRRTVEIREDLNEVKVEEVNVEGPRKKRQGSKDKPKSPRRKKRSGEAQSEEGEASIIAPTNAGSDDDQPRSKAKAKPKRSPRQPENANEEANGEVNDQNEVRRSSNGAKPKEHKASGTQIKPRAKDSHGKQLSKGTPPVHQQHQLDKALEGISAQIDSLPMSEVDRALNGVGDTSGASKVKTPVAPMAVAKRVDVVGPSTGKAASKASTDSVQDAKKEAASKEAKWDQMQADLDLAVCEEGGHAGMRAAPKL